jgi:poly(3-hydroxyalkanoate) depolymerase
MNTTPHWVRAYGQQIRVSVRPGRGEGPPLLLCNGIGEGPPLLLCNGIGAGFEALQPFVDALDPGIEVIRFDAPGAGGSPPGPIPYGFPGNALLVARMLDRLGHNEVDVLGLSWGGGLAQQLALQHRKRVRKLVLVATATATGMLMVPAHPRVLARMITPRRFRDADYAAEVAGILYGGTAREHPELVREALGDRMRLGSPVGYLHQLLAGAGWTSLPWLPLLTQPTLIIAGTDDPIIPLINARIMHRLIRGSELHVHEGGHVALVTEAATLAPVVTRFLHPQPLHSVRFGPSRKAGTHDRTAER